MVSLDSTLSWLRETGATVRKNGVGGLDSLWRPPYYKFLHQVERFQDPGMSIYDLNWDLLIILDACRRDLLEEVADGYEFLRTVKRIRSLDSMTPAWMERTFVPKRSGDMADTYYLCANPFSGQKLDATDFRTLDEIWRYAWDDEHDTVMPGPVTDRAINLKRSTDPERLLVHYIQPHWPFVNAMDLTKGGGMRLDEFGRYNRDEVWERLRRGEVSKASVWEGYRDNLTLALDSVETLLENVDADRVLITSDHGNAFGEYGVYGHPMHMPLDCLRTVPLVETSANDGHTYDPEPLDRTSATEDVEGQLRALGYA